MAFRDFIIVIEETGSVKKAPIFYVSFLTTICFGYVLLKRLDGNEKLKSIWYDHLYCL